MKKIVILGAGGFAREIQQLINDIGSHDVAGFLDDDSANHGKLIHGALVLGDFEWLKTADRSATHLALGIGSPRTKKKFVERALAIHNFHFPALVHPTAIVGQNVNIGNGAVITAGNCITVDIEIESFSMINLSCTIGHDSRIGKYASLNPHCTISGNTLIGEGAELYSNVTTVPSVKIGNWSAIGAGAVVTKDIGENKLAVGCPAKTIKSLDP